MTITKKTIEKKTGKAWTIDDVIDSNIVNVLFNDDMIAKYLFKSDMIKSVKYQAGRIVVYYGNGYRAIYE